MFCQKCGRETDGKFCGHCGETNILFEKNNTVEPQSVYTQQNTQYNQGYYSEPYRGVSTPVFAEKEKKSITPFIYLVLNGILNTVLVIIVTVILNGAYDSMLPAAYMAFSSLLYAVIDVLLLVMGIIIIRKQKLFLIAVGCYTVASALIQVVASVLRFILMTAFNASVSLYSGYLAIENFVVLVLTVVLSCVIYAVVDNVIGKKK